MAYKMDSFSRFSLLTVAAVMSAASYFRTSWRLFSKVAASLLLNNTVWLTITNPITTYQQYDIGFKRMPLYTHIHTCVWTSYNQYIFFSVHISRIRLADMSHKKNSGPTRWVRLERIKPFFLIILLIVSFFCTYQQQAGRRLDRRARVWQNVQK